MIKTLTAALVCVSLATPAIAHYHAGYAQNQLNRLQRQQQPSYIQPLQVPSYVPPSVYQPRPVPRPAYQLPVYRAPRSRSCAFDAQGRWLCY